MNTETEALAGIIREANATHTETVDGVTVLLAPDDFCRIEIPESEVDEVRGCPRRRTGTVVTQDANAFCALVHRYKSTSTVVYVDRAGPKLTAVVNDHEPVNVSDTAVSVPVLRTPGFRDHRVVYQPALSPEWQAWIRAEGTSLAQGDFAAFLEEHVLELFDEGSVGAKTRGVLDALGVKVAKPAQLRDLARDMTVRVKSVVREARSLQSGEVQVQYTTEHADADGRPLTVPGAFLVGIPVFVGGPLYVLVARLRYRVGEGKITWSYKLHGVQAVLDDVVHELSERVATDTGCLVVAGSP